MKHIFIINPNAGKGSAATELENKLKDSGFDWQVYRTTAPRLPATDMSSKLQFRLPTPRRKAWSSALMPRSTTATQTAPARAL